MNTINKYLNNLERSRKLNYIQQLRWKRDYILKLDNSDTIEYIIKDYFPNETFNINQKLQYLDCQSILVMDSRIFVGKGETQLESMKDLSNKIYRFKLKYYI